MPWIDIGGDRTDVRLQVSCKTLLYMPRVDLYVSRKDTKLVLLTIAVLISVAGKSWSHVLNGTTLKIRRLKSSTAGRWRYRYQLISGSELAVKRSATTTTRLRGRMAETLVVSRMRRDTGPMLVT